MLGLRAIVLAATLALVPAGSALAQSSQLSAKRQAIADLKQTAYAGDARSQVQLGLIYLTGDGVPKDDTEAMKWLRMAVEQDNPVGERYLAEMYFKGRGAPVDNMQAAKLLRMAAEQGDAQSEHNLAALYTQGLGVPKNMKEAANWMRKAADQNLADAQYALGVFYESGEGVAGDPIEAAKWYRRAVDQDFVPAMNSLALLMAYSINSSVRNTQAAVELAQRAVAARNNPEYLDTLASAYFANGQTDMAIAAEEKALAKDPENETYKKAMAKYLGAAHGSR
jgi:TPR repeat protein